MHTQSTILPRTQTRLVRFMIILLSGACSFTASGFQDSVLQQGIEVEISIDQVNEEDVQAKKPLQEGDKVIVKFKLSDAQSATPYRGANPAAWMDWIGDSPVLRNCTERATRYLSGSLFDQPDLDLNVFYVLALNEDPTITVVDPLFGFGGTKLLALVVLDSPGEDWEISRDNSYLYVSLPESNAIAVVDTSTWEVTENIEVAKNPRRIALQPDGGYLWVSSDENSPERSGVDVIRIADNKLIARIVTGAGRHDLAFTSGSEYAFVTNEDAGTVSVIDIRTLTEVKELPTGEQPVSIDYSNLAQAAYIANHADGKITVIDGHRHTILTSTLQLKEPGVVQIRVTPDGSFAFAPNPDSNTVSIIDTASNQLVHTAHVLDGPDQISFTNENAYIRHRNSETVLIVPLSEIGDSSKGVSIVDFPGGQHPLGKMTRTSVADAIVQASGHYAVLVANPSDEAIYYYKEGMAAPMGTFSNYGRQPRATRVVERNLRERKPGEYQTSVILRRPGEYKMVFYLDNPQIVHCFDLTVAPDPSKKVETNLPAVTVEVLESGEGSKATEPVKLAFLMTDRETQQPISGVPDFNVLLYSPAWQNRFKAAPGPDGVYTVDTIIPTPGTYVVALSIPSQGFQNMNYQWLKVQAKE